MGRRKNNSHAILCVQTFFFTFPFTFPCAVPGPSLLAVCHVTDDSLSVGQSEESSAVGLQSVLVLRWSMQYSRAQSAHVGDLRLLWSVMEWRMALTLDM